MCISKFLLDMINKSRADIGAKQKTRQPRATDFRCLLPVSAKGQILAIDLHYLTKFGGHIHVIIQPEQ